MTTDKPNKLIQSIADLIEKTSKEPKPVMVYSGIKKGTVGFVFGPSKSGKSTYCEALGMSIACGADSFMGLPIGTKGAKVLFISLEEHYTNRTERNAKQITKLVETHGKEWLSNKYFAIADEFPRHIETQEQWEFMAKSIAELEPDVVFIDSLTRLYAGSIEDSSLAKEVMKKLRHLADLTKTTIICIHHTSKMYDRPISLDTLAGSRVIGQEADFMIGINKTPKGVRYIKEVEFRYAPNNTDTVKTFKIDANQWLEKGVEVDEYKLLAATDGRKNERLDEEFEQIFLKNETVSSEMLTEEFVKSGKISKQALYERLKKDEKIVKTEKGIYKLKE